MAKVVYKSLKKGRSASPTARTVGKKRVVTEDGVKTVHTLDANSASFDEDLRYVFSRSVARARRDNKRVLGSVDVATRKR